MSDIGEAGTGRRGNKRAAVFRTIGEVADDLELPAHVLRFWESKFPQLKPLKRGGGRRYYRPEDIALLSRIRRCLYQDGYTIRGVQKLLSDGTLDAAAGAAEIVPSLFPLDPPSEAAPSALVKAPRAARRAPAPPKAAEPVEPKPLSEPGRAALEAAVQDLLSARHMLDALLHRTRKE